MTRIYTFFFIENSCEGSFIDINRDHAGSSWMAFFNIMCVVAGTGVLGLPLALKQGGWLGILILFLSWSMSIYNGIILVRCLYTGEKRLSTHKDIATSAFGWIGGALTFFFNAWIVLGSPVLYMVLAGSNINQLCQGTPGELGDLRWTIICCGVFATPFVLVKSMKEVAWMSAFGALATVVVVFICLVMAALDANHPRVVHHDSVVWDMFPIALSTISYSFGGNVIYPHVEASMKTPRHWNRVVAGGLSVCAALYFIMAISGYLIYGDQVVSPIYNSIPAGVPQQVAIVLITIHVLMASPILTTSFSLDLEGMLRLEERFSKHRFQEFVARTCIRLLIVVIIGVIACMVPHFSELMSLIGAFANCALIFILPVAFYLKLTGIRNKPFYELIWCALIVLLGIVGLIFGTMEAIKELIAAFT